MLVDTSHTIAAPDTDTAGSPPPDAARLELAPTRADQTVLDGGWWPRSWDAAAEVPGLVVALAERYGPIRHVMLSSATWDGGVRRLAVGERTVRMGWFASQDSALAIAITDKDDQIDLLVVPPATTPAAAHQAMAAAADPGDSRHAAAVLAALPAATAAPANAVDGNGRRATWENEGGSTAGQAAATAAATADAGPV
ncbi:DUF5994 family protein [Catellatospora vulcania]|uniref:DUF5994 family protein n=1 Tax=Catellatospora vulcania TaxID=1460450 RepID=UPI0012D3B715|nr:DUF5994 family protein [Catellatospora vulcania]